MGERTGGVWRERRGPGVPDDDEAEPGSVRRVGRGWGLTGLFALALSGLVLYLVWCVLWERSHPAGAAARGIRRGDSAARLKVIREVERLGPQDPEGAMPALIVALEDPEPDNRVAAAEGLVAVIQGVRMSDSDPGPVRDAVAALMAHLRDPEPAVRLRASESLLMIVILWRDAPRNIDLDAIELAIGAAARDPDAGVRMAAVRGLAVLGDPLSDDSPAPLLIAAMEDESEAVRVAASHSLALYQRGLLRLLPALVRSLEATRPECRPVYLNVLRQIRAVTYRQKELAKPLLQVLVPLLASRDRELRCSILSLIGEFESDAREFIPALLTALNEPGAGGSAGSNAGTAANDPAIAAARALARVAGHGTSMGPTGPTHVPPVREVVPALLKLLGSPAPGRRLAAINALRSFDADDAVIAALVASSRDRDGPVRAAALSALQNDPTGRRSLSLELLRDALEDDSPDVRAAAASAVDFTAPGKEPIVPALIRHAHHDPDRSVREMCANALSMLRPPAVTASVVPMYVGAIDRREAPALLRGNLIEALTQFGPAARGAIPAIVRVLRSTEAKGAGRSTLPHVPPGRMTNPPRSEVEEQDAYRDALERVQLRHNAVLALGRLAPGTPWAGEAVSAVVAALDDPDDEVNLQALEALVAFGPAAAGSAPALIRGLHQARKKKDLWRAGRMADALARVAPTSPEAAEAVAFLVEVLDSGDLPSRLFAERVLGTFGPTAVPAIPKLVALSREPEARGNEEHAAIATALGQIAPGTPGADRALAALLSLLDVEPDAQRIETVIGAVVRFGPAAAAALPRLRALTKSGDPRVSAAARKVAAALEGAGRQVEGAADSPVRPRSGPSPEGL